MAKISPYFPKPHEVSRADDRKVISGIVYVLKTGGNGRTPLRYADDRCDTSQSSQDGGELAERGLPRHIGRIRGGLNPKLHAVCNGDGRPVAMGITPCIPPKRGRKSPATFCKTQYKQRRKVENMLSKLKDWR